MNRFWLKSYPQGVPADIDPSRLATVKALIEGTCAAHADRVAYAQMGRNIAKPGTPFKFTDGMGGTSDPKYALIDAKTKQPVNNGLRDLWVTYTALTTALNSSYMASQIAMFGIVVGVALLLAGIGFGILALSGALRSREPAFDFMRKWTSKEEKELPAATA